MPLPPLFQSSQQFQQGFIQGLHRLLEDQGLGAYILVLANATFDENLFQVLQEALKTSFQEQRRRLQTHQAQQTVQQLPADDVAVFQCLEQQGWEQIQLAQCRQLSDWELQFNPLRALRPPRHAGSVIDCISAAFQAQAFHFNKPFLRKETLWSGELLGQSIDLLYNKFPFVPWHGLLVPERERQWPQFLDASQHAYIWQLCEHLSQTLPGIAVGYNAYGAYASVNHLHFQLFIREEPLPLEASHWQHHQGEQAYPVSCEVFSDHQQAYDFISELHAQQRTYNLLYRPGRVYCLPRRFQGQYTLSDPTYTQAWYEVCGGRVCFDAEQFAHLKAADIDTELQKL